MGQFLKIAKWHLMSILSFSYEKSFFTLSFVIIISYLLLKYYPFCEIFTFIFCISHLNIHCIYKKTLDIFVRIWYNTNGKFFPLL